MLASSLAFAWILWRQYGRGLFIVLGYSFCASILSTLLVPYCTPGTKVGDVGLILALTLTALPPISLLGIFTYVFEGADVRARESCFPTRLFRLPVSTGSLVIWPMVFGAVAAVGLWLVVGGFVLRPLASVAIDGPLPQWWPALFLAAALAWVQALLWCPFGLRWLRFFLLLCLFEGLIVAAGVSAASGFSEVLLAIAYAGLTAVAWLVAYVGVRLGRRGDVPNWEAILKPLYQIALRWPRRRSRFASAAQAQVWYEWRQNGWWFPCATAGGSIGLLLFFALMPLLIGEKAFRAGPTLLFCVAAPVLIAGLSGARRTVLGSSSATLPLSTADMVSARLKVEALSSLAAWAVTVAAMPVVVIASGNLDVVAGWWRQVQVEHHPVQVSAGIVALAILLFVAMWRRQVDQLCFSLTGQAWIAAATAIFFFLGTLFLGILAGWLYHRPETHETVLTVLPGLLGALVLCRLLVTMWALRELLRRGLLRPRTATNWLASWLLVASVLFGLLLWAIPTQLVPVHYLAFGVLFAMPMARLAAIPLALARNRHR